MHYHHFVRNMAIIPIMKINKYYSYNNCDEREMVKISVSIGVLIILSRTAVKSDSTNQPGLSQWKLWQAVKQNKWWKWLARARRFLCRGIRLCGDWAENIVLSSASGKALAFICGQKIYWNYLYSNICKAILMKKSAAAKNN